MAKKVKILLFFFFLSLASWLTLRIVGWNNWSEPLIAAFILATIICVILGGIIAAGLLGLSVKINKAAAGNNFKSAVIPIVVWRGEYGK